MNSIDRLDATIILVHAAWADASSWNKVILPLRNQGWKVVSVLILLTSLFEDLDALRRRLNRTSGPVRAERTFGTPAPSSPLLL